VGKGDKYPYSSARKQIDHMRRAQESFRFSTIG
jgi:hypothetical protein